MQQGIQSTEGLTWMTRPFQETCAMADARAHTCAKAFRKVINHTRKSDFSLLAFTT